MAGADTASAASATGQYNCKFPGLGLTFNDPWTVTLNANIPESVDTGASIPAPTITAHIVTGSDAADPLRGQDIVTGTSAADYTVAGQARKANLNVTGLPYTVPATGGVVTDASGTGEAETAPSTPSTVDVVAGDFTASLTLKSGFVANLTCTPANAGGHQARNHQGRFDGPDHDRHPGTDDHGTHDDRSHQPGTHDERTDDGPDRRHDHGAHGYGYRVHERHGLCDQRRRAGSVGLEHEPDSPIVSTDYVNTNNTAGIADPALTAAGFVALGGAVVAGRRNRG